MATPTRGPSLTLHSPKTPPGFPDLYGKRRDMARVHMLEREISFLEEELKSSEGLQPASRCCKEIADFVMANSDPVLPTSKKNRRSCSFWKWLCGMPCFNLSWIFCWCCDGCSEHLKWPSCCCHCKPCCNWISSCLPSINCSLPKWGCCSGQKSHCCKDKCGCKNCCIVPSCNFGWPFPSCCLCKCSCSCSCPSCPKIRPCCCCTKSCWKPCCSCC
ncbi:guanine nucleotide-binding protein subunit gamma 3-like [Gastrolobium bilobum]|uniref:guanine nucleotide-binding protein subunit gamma 3-like n=1 Tax=Gastrolobium bilobum TaxID=150636 RepID=UPI002AB178F4|nr:guanine nucleotide-binding protein subunit gamma 3-like [Gastrolobium bilobum]